MPDTRIKELKEFLQPYSAPVRKLVWELRSFTWALYPTANELIYDNYNAVAIGWSASDKLKDCFCNIAVYSTYVHFGFYWGNELSDPEKRLQGNGHQYRYIQVATATDFPKTYVRKLLKEAWAHALSKLPLGRQTITGITVVKSISAKKRRPAAE